MHVLQLGPYPPPEGGISRNMLAIRDELRAEGHRCSIIATAKSSKITAETDVYHPRSAKDLVGLLRNLKYDVLHLHIGGEIPLRVLSLMATCAFFGRGKSVLSLHSGGYAVENAPVANYFSRDAFVFRAFRRIIAVNPLMVEMFKKFGVKSERIRQIYPFSLRNPDQAVEIPTELKKFAERHQPFLLTVSLLEDTYDLFMQIDALEKVLEKLPRAGLLIAGSGILENDLKRAVAAKSYANNIFLAGDTAHPITLHLIEKADILLRTTKFDGDAISVREALFLETPVITTDNKMRPAGVELIPVHDSAALVEKIIEVSAIEKQAKHAKPDDQSNITAILAIYREITEKKNV